MYENELYHHGILGQKWGVRRFQNEDGSLTSAGKKRYSQNDNSNSSNDSTESKRGLSGKAKTALKVGAAVAASALVAYGAYKLSGGDLSSLTNIGEKFMKNNDALGQTVKQASKAAASTKPTPIKIAQKVAMPSNMPSSLSARKAYTSSETAKNIAKAVSHPNPEVSRQAKQLQDFYSGKIDLARMDLNNGKISVKDYSKTLNMLGDIEGRMMEYLANAPKHMRTGV